MSETARNPVSGPDTDRTGDRQASDDRSDDTHPREEEGDAEALAGPHAKPSLTNPDATPGAGALPADTSADEVDPGAG